MQTIFLEGVRGRGGGGANKVHYGKCGSVESEKTLGTGLAQETMTHSLLVGIYADSPLKKGKMADGSPRMNCVDIQPPPQSLLLLK